MSEECLHFGVVPIHHPFNSTTHVDIHFALEKAKTSLLFTLALPLLSELANNCY